MPVVVGTIDILGSLAWEVLGAKEPFSQLFLFHNTSSHGMFYGGMINVLHVSLHPAVL